MHLLALKFIIANVWNSGVVVVGGGGGGESQGAPSVRVGGGESQGAPSVRVVSVESD